MIAHRILPEVIRTWVRIFILWICCDTTGLWGANIYPLASLAFLSVSCWFGRCGWAIIVCDDNSTLHWRHNDHDGVSNHQPHGCLLNRLFRRRSKKTSMLRVTGLCVGNSPGPVNSPHKGPITRKMFPFDDVIMDWLTVEFLCPYLPLKFQTTLLICEMGLFKLNCITAHS